MEGVCHTYINIIPYFEVNFKMLDWEIYEKDLFRLWNSFYVEYASPYADEPVTSLSMKEVEIMLNKIIFTKKKSYDRCIKLIIRLHCLGVTDTVIADGLRLLGQNIEANTIKQIRHKALEKIDKKFNKQIGLITLMYETFHEVTGYEE